MTIRRMCSAQRKWLSHGTTGKLEHSQVELWPGQQGPMLFKHILSIGLSFSLPGRFHLTGRAEGQDEAQAPCLRVCRPSRRSRPPGPGPFRVRRLSSSSLRPQVPSLSPSPQFFFSNSRLPQPPPGPSLRLIDHGDRPPRLPVPGQCGPGPCSSV
jgi:hypothetical protein